MTAAVVELDTLADTVRTAAKNHNLLRIIGYSDFALLAVVGRIVVSLILDARNGDLMPRLDTAELYALSADILLGNTQKLRKILVGEAVLLSLNEHFVGEKRALISENLLFFGDELAHLVDEMTLNAGARENLLVRRALTQSLVHLEVALGVRYCEHIKKLVERLLVEILGEAETGATAFKSADRLLESLLISLTDRHYLADGLHLGTEMVLHGAELLERPASELKNDIIARRSILIEATVTPVGNFVERVARGELSRNKRDREARRLRSER